MSRKIVIALTGGGTAGHVMPHLALLDDYRQKNWDAFYIGSKGIEEDLLKGQPIPFYKISSGKLRRYFSWENFTDLFRVGVGVVQSVAILRKKKPDLVFSKGGFVSVPVCVAARMLGIPVVSHESDLSPGLANRIIAKFAQKIFYSFPETERFIAPGRGELVGLPVRKELFRGDRAKGLKLCGFDDAKDPVILVMGGSLGAKKINDALADILPTLVKQAYVIHITGKGKGISFEHPRYKAFEYVKDELKDLFAATDLIVARAGANSIFEFLALRKPMLLIPLEVGSRGDQIDNAENFTKHGWAITLREGQLDGESLIDAVRQLRSKAPVMREVQEKSQLTDANVKVLHLLEKMV